MKLAVAVGLLGLLFSQGKFPVFRSVKRISSIKTSICLIEIIHMLVKSAI